MKRIVTFLNFFLVSIALFAQVPAGFNYQAVVRNNSGEVIANSAVKFRMSILLNLKQVLLFILKPIQLLLMILVLPILLSVKAQKQEAILIPLTGVIIHVI
jgi:hypothetical protein